MNLVVAFEGILFICCLISLNLARQAFFPASLFWAFGAVAVGVMALLGGLKYAGYAALDGHFTMARHFAQSIGLTAFALGAVAGLFASFFSRFYWPILLLVLAGLSVALTLGYWRFPQNLQLALMGIILLVGIIRLFSSSLLAVYLLLSVACLVAAQHAVRWLAVNTGLEEISVQLVLLSIAVVSFGLAASRDEWD
ncbi:hypothetical protein [Sneathiella sp.]|uniref:hypothetical protein n=1 Tax=Sneathiella sp. TaxID=1964365 RepID=UPI002FE1ED1A